MHTFKLAALLLLFAAPAAAQVSTPQLDAWVSDQAAIASEVQALKDAAAVNAGMAAQIVALQAQVAQLTQEKAALQSQVTTLSNQNAALTQQVATLTQQLAAANAEIARLQAIIDGTTPPDPPIPPVGFVKPDATNTGPRSSACPSGLASMTSVKSTANNQTLKCFKTSGQVTITHTGVTVTDFEAGNVYGYVSGKESTLNTTVRYGRLANSNSVAGINTNGTSEFNDISGAENGFNCLGTVIVRSNYVHDLGVTYSGPHYDAIQCDGGNSNSVIEGNTFQMRSGSGVAGVVMVDNFYGTQNNVTINNNWLSGANFSIYVDGHFQTAPIQGAKVTNNIVVQAAQYGFLNAPNTTGLVCTGNKTAAGAAISC